MGLSQIHVLVYQLHRLNNVQQLIPQRYTLYVSVIRIKLAALLLFATNPTHIILTISLTCKARTTRMSQTCWTGINSNLVRLCNVTNRWGYYAVSSLISYAGFCSLFSSHCRRILTKIKAQMLPPSRQKLIWALSSLMDCRMF